MARRVATWEESPFRKVVNARRGQFVKNAWILDLECGHTMRRRTHGVTPIPARARCKFCAETPVDYAKAG